MILLTFSGLILCSKFCYLAVMLKMDMLQFVGS